MAHKADISTRQNKAGSVYVEAIFAIVLLVLMIGGVLVLGPLIDLHMAISSASYEGARFGSNKNNMSVGRVYSRGFGIASPQGCSNTARVKFWGFSEGNNSTDESAADWGLGDSEVSAFGEIHGRIQDILINSGVIGANASTTYDEIDACEILIETELIRPPSTPNPAAPLTRPTLRVRIKLPVSFKESFGYGNKHFTSAEFYSPYLHELD